MTTTIDRIPGEESKKPEASVPEQVSVEKRDIATESKSKKITLFAIIGGMNQERKNGLIILGFQVGLIILMLVAFILAPLLLTIGAAVYVLGIGLTPFGTDSWVDGIFQAYGFVIMIPVLFELARILGQRAPIFGIICAIAGLGWGIFTIPASDRLLQMDLISAGLNESVWNVSGNHPGWTPLIIWMLLGMLTPLLLGIGFLWKGGIPRRAAGLLILATIFFAIGVGGGAEIAFWQTGIMYPLACLMYLVALAPIGLRYLAGGGQV